MALFNKLFSSNKRKLAKPSIQQTTQSRFSFNSEQVRVVLFRECDWRGRRLLFDSSALENVNSQQTTQTNLPPNGLKPPIKHEKSQYNVEYCDGVAYKYGRPNTDYNSIGEMIFGSVAMSFRGTCFKVHWLQQPTRIMCSQVFLAPVQPYSSTSSSSTNTASSSSAHAHTSTTSSSDPLGLISDISSLDTNSLNSFSCASDSVHSILSNSNLLTTPRTIPLDVPTQLTLDNDDLKFCSQSIGESSGYNSADPWNSRNPYPYSSARSSLASIYSDFDSRRLSVDSISTSDYPLNCEFGRFNRRIMKNLSTSFENLTDINGNLASIIENNYYTVTGASNLGGLSDGCVSKLRRNSESVESKRKAISGDALSSSSSSHHRSSRRPRLGIAVCITLSDIVEEDMLCFCAEHMALLESMLYRLRAACESAYISRPQFMQIMLKSWHTTSTWLRDLFTAPRIMNPVWLSLSIGSVKNPTVLANSFVNDLCILLNTADTKDTNFFVSTLITAVLTHHLGWVGSVAPLITSNIRDNICKNNKSNPLMKELLEQENYKLSEISKNYPYNALWAQLGDLYGALANPIKITKTVICGNESNLQTIERLLNILTYFIRCNEIKKTKCSKVFDKELINKMVYEQINGKTNDITSLFTLKSSSIASNSKSSLRKSGSGLSRTSTTVKDLSVMGAELESLSQVEESDPENPEAYQLLLNILKKNVMNDIPKVLAFRDSRFVKQELRIGNKSIDPGIEMNLRDKMFLKNYKKDLILSAEQIKLTVTRPDNEGVEEMIEFEDDFKRDCNKFISLSNLITENSLGTSKGIKLLNWKSMSGKECLNLEQIKHLERLAAIEEQKQEELEFRNLTEAKNQSGGVVFVLGDNDKLIGLKTSSSSHSLRDCADERNESCGAVKRTNSCKHKGMKHSGVKFNFEQYPQIATNYMKSKNLEFSELEILEKGMKLEREMKINCGASTSSGYLINNKLSSETLKGSDDDNCETEECECCKNGGAHYLQTPSNASELEFSSDNDYLSPTSDRSDKFFGESKSNLLHQLSQSLATLDENSALLSEQRSDEHSKLKTVEIPMPENIETPCKDESGFTPSLFAAVSDHYIADMVLQGTTSPISKWETILRQDLTISSHCAVLEQQQAENVAIVANIDKFDVRLLSSHSSSLSNNSSSASGIVGMSQLVAAMLETVQMMWNSGLPAYQCMSFIESKLKEMYLQSETLAAFLLETEFCTLNTLTKLLDLSANDIPLLMSIASIHSPQVTKKYGISFR